jgi:hypothetical protein
MRLNPALSGEWRKRGMRPRRMEWDGNSSTVANIPAK